MEVDCKRFYVPPFEWTCPVCGTEHTFDYYISYPRLNASEDVTGSCWHEDTPHEDEPYWEGTIARATVRVDIEVIV